MRDLRVRPARPDEAVALTRIAHAAKRHWGYPETWMALWRAELTVSPAFIETHLTSCAVLGGQIVGFYALSQVSADWELEHLWIEPAHIGRGIGSLLLAHALQTTAARGGARLLIASDPHAEGFYLRMGAERLGRRPSIPAGRTLPLLAIRLVPPEPLSKPSRCR